jgi:tryptophan-rich sensory protein
MNFIDTVKREFRDLFGKHIISGMILNFVIIAVSLAFGRELNLLTLTWLIMGSIQGATLCIVLCNNDKNREVSKYKGVMLYLIMLVFNIIWMPLMYRAESPVLAFMDLFIISLLNVYVAHFFGKVNHAKNRLFTSYSIFFYYTTGQVFFQYLPSIFYKLFRNKISYSPILALITQKL